MRRGVRRHFIEAHLLLFLDDQDAATAGDGGELHVARVDAGVDHVTRPFGRMQPDQVAGGIAGRAFVDHHVDAAVAIHIHQAAAFTELALRDAIVLARANIPALNASAPHKHDLLVNRRDTAHAVAVHVRDAVRGEANLGRGRREGESDERHRQQDGREILSTHEVLFYGTKDAPLPWTCPARIRY